jgi:hypothetical protein
VEHLAQILAPGSSWSTFLAVEQFFDFGTLFKLWHAFPAVEHFFGCGTLFRLWSSFLAVEHFLRLEQFFCRMSEPGLLRLKDDQDRTQKRRWLLSELEFMEFYEFAE